MSVPQTSAAVAPGPPQKRGSLALLGFAALATYLTVARITTTSED